VTITAYALAAGEMKTAAALQAAVGQRYHVGFDDGTHFYGYMLVADTAQSGGWHEKTDIAAKDAQIQYASPNIIDRDFVFWPRVTQGDWSGGGNQITFIAPNQYWDSDLDTRVPGYLTLRSRMQRTTTKSNATAFVGNNLQQIVPFSGDFFFSFCEATTFYDTNGSFTTHGAKQPVILDTDGNSLYIGDQVNTVGQYNTSVVWNNDVFNALAGGLGSFNQMWVIDHGTFGHFLYYGSQGSNQKLFKVDLSLAFPVAAVNHVQVPTDNLSELIQDIVPYQNGIAILTFNAWNTQWSLWFHDGANMTPIVRMQGYFAAGMCNCMGDLFIGTYNVRGFTSPILWRVSSGSIAPVAVPGPPVPGTIIQGCLQPRASSQRVYWPVQNTNPQFPTNAISVIVVDVVTGAVSRLPVTDANDLQIATFVPLGLTFNSTQHLRRVAVQGDTVAFTNSTGTAPSAFNLFDQYQVANSQVAIQTPPYQASGKIITSRIDFQTPGVEKRFRRFEAQHASLPTNTSVKIDAFIDKDPAAYTAALMPDATLTNSTAATVTTELFLNNLIGHTVYFAITLASSDGLNTPILNYYFVEATTPWSWEMLLDCSDTRTTLTGELDAQGVMGKDLAYFFRNAWESPAKLTMYHRNGNSYTVAVESLDFWNPSPHVPQGQQVRGETYFTKVILRQTL
jgi:hypothetical protein